MTGLEAWGKIIRKIDKRQERERERKFGDL